MPVVVKGKQLGSGSFGTVYLATHSTSGEQVVLKEVNLRGLNAKDVKSSMAEVEVLKRLKHPNVIAYVDSYKETGQLCIVMEYASGGDLGSLIRKKAKEKARLPEPQVLKILAQLMSALAYCHSEMHLLHRDIKPENIFLTAGGDVKLGDFGISRIMTSTNALASTQCGTPLFMSPELAAGKPYDSGADVWALGCVLYSMMALRAPWEDQLRNKAGMMELLRLITSSTLDLSSVRGIYSAELCNLLASLLAKPASNRPSSKLLLSSALLKRVDARPAGPPPTLRERFEVQAGAGARTARAAKRRARPRCCARWQSQ
jgi:serine/threonine protein kinase